MCRLSWNLWTSTSWTLRTCPRLFRVCCTFCYVSNKLSAETCVLLRHNSYIHQPSVRTNTNRSFAECYPFEHVCLRSVSFHYGATSTAPFCAVCGAHPASFSVHKLRSFSRPWNLPLNAWSKTAILSYVFVTRSLFTRSRHITFQFYLLSVCPTHLVLWFYHFSCSGWRIPVTKPLVM